MCMGSLTKLAKLLKLSIKYGPGHIPAGWLNERQEEYDNRYKELYPQGKLEKRYATIFSPVAFAWALDEILEESNVDLWLVTLACRPLVVGNKVTGVEVENKSGRITIKASCIIDGSGDADTAYRVGAPCEEQGSYPSFLYQYTSLALARETFQKKSANCLVMYRIAGVNEMDEGQKGSGRKYLATKGKDVTAFIMESSKIARETASTFVNGFRIFMLLLSFLYSFEKV